MDAKDYLKSKFIKEPTYEGVRLVDHRMEVYRIVDLLEEYAALKASEGNQANSENANCAIFDVSGSLLIPDVHTEKNMILARAINYIADDVQEDGNKLAKEIAEGLITLLDKQ